MHLLNCNSGHFGVGANPA